jgi:hypothetical protein
MRLRKKSDYKSIYQFCRHKPKTDAGLYGLRYAKFVVPLVKAMQEQQQQIEQLKKENADSKQTIIALQNRLAAIEKKLNP